jgi:small-conductance mechanosensitive channel
MAIIAQTPIVPTTDISVITDEFDLSTITTTDAVVAVVALVSSVLLSWITKRVLRRVMNDIDGMPVLAADVIARIVSYVILTLGVVMALEALGFSFGLLGSVFMLLINEVEGNIDEVSARTVRVITVDGKRVHFPNRAVLEGVITNLTSEGQRMTTFTVGAAYDTDLERAREVIVTALGTTTAVLAEPPPEAFVQEFGESTINIACRFWHEPEIQAEWAARDEAMRAVKRALDEHGITIAFPQRVLWNAPTAG